MISNGLEWLLGPDKVGEFVAERFLRSPWFIPGAGRTESFAGLLTVNDIAQIGYAAAGPSEHWNILVRDNTGTTTIPVNAQSDIVATAVTEAYSEGKSVVLRKLHRTWPPIIELARAVEDSLVAATGVALKRTVTTNGILTPPGCRSVGVHYDDCEIFALQISGCKRWMIYEPLEDLSWPAACLGGLKQQDCGPLLLDVILQPDDLLYMPRGYPHRVIAAGEGRSVSLSLASRSYTRGDLVEEAGGVLPAGQTPWWRQSLLRQNLPEIVAEMPGLDASGVEAAFDRLYAAALPERVPWPPVQLDAVDRARLADTATVFRTVHSSGVCHLLPGGRLVYPAYETTVPAEHTPVVQRLIDGATVTAAAFAQESSCDADTALQVLRRLTAEGFLAPEA